jgi:hypothetical protein
MSMTGFLKRKLTIRVGLPVCLAACLLPAVFANAAEAESSADFRIVSGSESVVPVSIEAGEVIADVIINGRGPFPLMFDTGAQDAVTPETAATLGLKTEGSGTARDSGGDKLAIAFSRVAAMRLGDAEMTDQPFAVLPLPRYLTDRGDRPQLAGFIGYELLARFAVRLDYDAAGDRRGNGRSWGGRTRTPYAKPALPARPARRAAQRDDDHRRPKP